APHGLARRIVFERPAGLRVHLGRDGLPDGTEMLPGLGVTARHEGGTEPRADLAAAHAGAEEAAARLVLLLALDGVRPLAIAAVHHDVVGLDARAEELFHHRVHRRARLDEDEDLARLLQRRHEVRQ